MMGNWNAWLGGWGYGFGLLMIWSLVWKALALWKAAREGSKPWFAAFLIINTAGILEIVYLFFFAKEKLTLSTITSSAPKAKSKKK